MSLSPETPNCLPECGLHLQRQRMDREKSGMMSPLHAFVFREVSVPDEAAVARFGGWAEAPRLFCVEPLYYSNSLLASTQGLWIASLGWVSLGV